MVFIPKLNNLGTTQQQFLLYVSVHMRRTYKKELLSLYKTI